MQKMRKRYLRFNKAPVNCLPLALKIPAVTAAFPSNTWKSATNGKMDATIPTTSVSQFPVSLLPHDENCSIQTWIVIEKVPPHVSEYQKHGTRRGGQKCCQ